MQPSLELAPLDRCSFGRKAVGTTIAEVLDSPTLKQQIRDALDEHGVLLFPGQQLDPEQEAAFAKLFPWDDSVSMLTECAGPFATAQSTGVVGAGAANIDRWKLPALPMVQCQGDGPVRDHHGVPDGELSASQTFAEWHTDGVHDTPRTTQPPVATTMYCLATPACGGETLFASARAGFEALPEALQQRARGLTAVFDGRFRPMVPGGTRAQQPVSGGSGGGGGGDWAETRRFPLVARDGRGREGLYGVAPAFTRCLLEADGTALGEEEGQALLDQILHHALRLPADGRAPPHDGQVPIVETANLYAHRWAAGDLVVWDNRTMLHSASPSPRYKGRGTRLFHRVRMSSRVPVTPAFSAGFGVLKGENHRTQATSATSSAQPWCRPK